MNTQNVNVKTATRESSERWVMSSAEPIAAKVLADLKAVGAPYARRNIIADIFQRLAVN